MTEKQQKLSDALDAADIAVAGKWEAVIEATNELRQGIFVGDEYYDAGFPPELERKFDRSALRTAWIYDRLESARGKDRRLPTRVKIRKALGYSG